MSQRLRSALLRKNLDVAGLAAAVGVDAKTVTRWLSGRIPRQRTRLAVADVPTRSSSRWSPTACGGWPTRPPWRAAAMTGRRDYYHDPAAPTANSLVPGGSALVVDDHGRVLLQRRADSGNWAVPGGTMDIGETLGQCVIREVKEETGLDIEISGLLGIYTDPQHVIAYADGEVRQEFNVTYLGRVIGGTIAVSDESTDVRFINPADFDRIPIHDTVRLRLRHHAEHRDHPYLG